MSEWTREEAIKEAVARGIEWAKCAKELKECKEALRKQAKEIFADVDRLTITPIKQTKTWRNLKKRWGCCE